MPHEPTETRLWNTRMLAVFQSWNPMSWLQGRIYFVITGRNVLHGAEGSVKKNRVSLDCSKRVAKHSRVDWRASHGATDFLPTLLFCDPEVASERSFHENFERGDEDVRIYDGCHLLSIIRPTSAQDQGLGFQVMKVHKPRFKREIVFDWCLA